MDALPPIQVTVDTRGWTCVLDLRLALAQLGPLMALRLAEELRVLLVPRLWYVLDHTDYFRAGSAARVDRDSTAPPTAVPDPEALALWERARFDTALPARLFWAGDSLHDSSLPKDVDPEVIARFEYLCQGLDRRWSSAHSDSPPLLESGALDAAALAAAMTRYRPLILTLAGAREAGPEFCRVLGDCGVACRQLGEAESAPLRRQLVVPLARTSALELCWAGLALAAVHLVTPRALLLDTGRSGELPGSDERLPTHGPDDPWHGASAYWYSLP